MSETKSGRPKIYASPADRLRAWRQRRQEAQHDQHETKGWIMPTAQESIDVQDLSHVNAHPDVARMLHRRFEVQARLTALDGEIPAQRRVIDTIQKEEVISTLGQEGDWRPSPRLQTAHE